MPLSGIFGKMRPISKPARFLLSLSLIFLFSMSYSSLGVPTIDAASVTLAWDPNSEPDVVGYRLYYGKAMGNHEFMIDVGNQTTWPISDLEDGETYYFAVTAYNANGLSSGFSNELRYPEPFSMTISLSAGLNLISLPLEPINRDAAALTERLSPCLRHVFAYANDAWVSYDPAQPGQSTLNTLEPGKGYWFDMACPAEMTVVGNRTTNSISLIPGLNLVGYSSLIPLAVSEALSSIANKYNFVWGYKDSEWTYYDPSDQAGSPLRVLTPGSGYWIEATEETTWTLPWVMTIPLSAGLNLISLPVEPLNPEIGALTGQVSSCLRQVFAYENGTWLSYDPLRLEQRTLTTMEPGKGYWFDMACPAEMTVVGNRTTKPISLVPGLNLVGYSSLTPLPVSEALLPIANKYSLVWGYKGDEWTYYDPSDQVGSTLQVLTPGSGYWIEALEETTWLLP